MTRDERDALKAMGRLDREERHSATVTHYSHLMAQAIAGAQRQGTRAD